MTLGSKLGSLSVWFFNSWHKVKWFFLVLCEQAGNKLHSNMSHVQIHGQNLLTGTSTHTCSFWDLVICVLTVLDFFDILILLMGAQNEDDLQRSFLFFCTVLTTWKLVCSSVIPQRPFEASRVLLWPFFQDKQNLKQICCFVWSDITISWEDLENAWENWQHKPLQTSTATSTWLLTHEGCNYTHLVGEHSTMIRKSSLKPVRVFLGPPSYSLCCLYEETSMIVGCMTHTMSKIKNRCFEKWVFLWLGPLSLLLNYTHWKTLGIVQISPQEV